VRRLLGPASSAVLGLNLWAALLLVPALHTDALARKGALGVVLLGVPLVALAAGVWMLAARGERARLALLGVFPGTLLLPALVDPLLVGPGAHGGFTFAATIVSFGAYLGGVAWLLARGDEPTVATKTTRLRHPQGDPRMRDRTRDRRLMLALALAVPVAIFVLPLARPGAGADARAAYPDAPDAALAAIAAIAAALSAGVLLVYFGPALRRARAESVAHPSARVRVAWTLASVALGIAAAFALVSR